MQVIKHRLLIAKRIIPKPSGVELSRSKLDLRPFEVVVEVVESNSFELVELNSFELVEFNSFSFI